MTTITTSPLEDGYDFFISDRWGKEYHFKIISFEVPSGMLSLAVKLQKKQRYTIPGELKYYQIMMLILN